MTIARKKLITNTKARAFVCISACCHHGFFTHASSVNKKCDTRILQITLALVIGLAFFEWYASRLSHGLVLVADAIHLFSDGLAVGLSLLTVYLNKKLAARQIPLKIQKIEALTALINSIGTIALSVWVFWEALQRLRFDETQILSYPILLAAIASLAINSINLLLLHSCDRNNLNIKGAFLHVLADIGGSLGSLLAAIAVSIMHWTLADAIISAIVSSLIILCAVPLIVKSLQTLREEMPTHQQTIALGGKFYTLEDLLPNAQQLSIFNTKNFSRAIASDK
jgi:cobalt-zinc-cadmium efflux system protein